MAAKPASCLLMASQKCAFDCPVTPMWRGQSNTDRNPLCVNTQWCFSFPCLTGGSWFNGRLCIRFESAETLNLMLSMLSFLRVQHLLVASACPQWEQFSRAKYPPTLANLPLCIAWPELNRRSRKVRPPNSKTDLEECLVNIFPFLLSVSF